MGIHNYFRKQIFYLDFDQNSKCLLLGQNLDLKLLNGCLIFLNSFLVIMQQERKVRKEINKEIELKHSNLNNA